MVEQTRDALHARWLKVTADYGITSDGAPVTSSYVLEYPDRAHVAALDQHDKIIPAEPARKWLHGADGGYVKLDAIDHSCAHDVIGCQDIAWDLAGAAAEFHLSAKEADVLRLGVEEHGGLAIDPAAVSFFDVCYAAFHLGLWTYAGDSPGAGRQRQFYRDRLDAILLGADR